MTQFTQHGSKIQCTICGRTGYEGGTWMEQCARDHHPYECDCGRVFTTSTGLSAHQNPRRQRTTP